MEVSVHFSEIKEVGEMQPPQIIETIKTTMSFPAGAIPRYKDQIDFKGRRYVVHDVLYKQMKLGSGTWIPMIAAYYNPNKKQLSHI